MQYTQEQNPIGDAIQPASRLVFTKLLRPGEKLLWADQPRQTNCVNPRNQPMLLFGAVWVVFNAALLFVVWRSGHLGAALLWGAMSTIVLLWTVGLLRGEVQRRAGTHCALTDSRIITYEDGVFLPVKSVELGSIGDITVSQQSRECGTLTFYAPGTKSKAINLLPTFFPSSVPIAEFVQIKDAERVSAKIKRLQSGLPRHVTV